MASQETRVDNGMGWMEDKVEDLRASRNVVPRHRDSCGRVASEDADVHRGRDDHDVLTIWRQIPRMTVSKL